MAVEARHFFADVTTVGKYGYFLGDPLRVTGVITKTIETVFQLLLPLDRHLRSASGNLGQQIIQQTEALLDVDRRRLTFIFPHPQQGL